MKRGRMGDDTLRSGDSDLVREVTGELIPPRAWVSSERCARCRAKPEAVAFGFGGAALMLWRERWRSGLSHVEKKIYAAGPSISERR